MANTITDSFNNPNDDLGADAHWTAAEEEPLEWDADSTEGADVDFQPLPEYEPTLFTEVPGREVIDAQ